MMIAGAIVKLGDHIAAFLDDKPVGPTRTTTFVFSGQEPNQAVPPDAGQRRLSPAEDGYETVDPDEAPEAR